MPAREHALLAGAVMKRGRRPPRLRGWLDRRVLAAASLAGCSGFALYAVTVALGEVAGEFGMDTGRGVAAEVGMTGTALGVGLAVIRLGSLASLPAAGLADRLGRRRVLVGCCGLGLALTAAAGAAHAFWLFVVLLALARPLMAATNAVAGVIAAEETTSGDRSKAIALVGASYALGSGAAAILRGLFDAVGFRELLAAALVLLVLVPFAARRVGEPDRFRNREVDPARRPRLGSVPTALRARLATVCAIHFGVGLVTGPVNTYLFVYAENVVGITPAVMSGLVVAAGAGGLLGLIAGRWGADRLGRRVTAGVTLVAASLAGLITYSGPAVAVGVGFVVTTVAAAAFAPAAGSLDAEIFPTSVRATAAGWLTAVQVLGGVVGLAGFGIIADAFGAFPPAAAAVTVPAALLAGLYVRLPETRGQELEESAPEPFLITER